MDDLMCVHVVTCSNELKEEETRLGFGIALPPSKQVVQVLYKELVSYNTFTCERHLSTYPVLTKSHSHIHMLIILKTILKLNDVGML